MHTFSVDHWRIHHNGGFHGDILICLKINDTNYIEHRTTSDELLANVKRDWMTKSGLGEDFVVVLKAKTDDGKDAELGIPLDVLVSFVTDRFVRRGLEEWLEQASANDLMKLLPFVEGISKGG